MSISIYRDKRVYMYLCMYVCMDWMYGWLDGCTYMRKYYCVYNE